MNRLSIVSRGGNNTSVKKFLTSLIMNSVNFFRNEEILVVFWPLLEIHSMFYVP